MRTQHLFHLARLDAEAANLHLVVRATQELHLAVGTPAGAVPRAAQAGARLGRKRVGQESRRVQLGIHVAAGHALATNVQLAGHSDRRRLTSLVQHVQPHIGKRAADRDQAGDGGGRLALEVRAIDRRFRQAVGVDQPRRGTQHRAGPAGGPPQTRRPSPPPPTA